MSEYQRWQIDSILGWIKTYFTICEWMNIHLLTVNRDLSKRSLTEILPTELLYRDLVQRSCQETSCIDLVQRPGEENRDLVQRSFIESVKRDFTLKSLTQILC